MRAHFLPFALIAAISISACRKAEVTSYRIPKEHDREMAPATGSATAAADNAAGPAASAAPSMANAAVPTATGAGLAWTAPAHWQSRPASAMRKATYAIAGDDGAAAELSITAFPSDVGGELANVNRWRGQLQLPPLPENEATGVITRLEANGLKIAFVDFTNPDGTSRMLGAIVPFEGATWFFKLTGPAALLGREKPAFTEFLKSLRPAQ